MIAAMCVTLLCGASLVRAAEQSESQSVRFAATLLTLYRQSDAIYLARFDKREDGRVLMTDPSYTVVEVETEFTILSTLKGEDRKLLNLTDEDFRYRLAAQPDSGYAPEVRFAINASSIDRSKTPEPGDTVLVFVRQAGSPGNCEIVDSRDGMKKLSTDERSIYVDRIKELNTIFSAKQPQPSAIAAWLVKCAEEPATRWDAAFELERGFRQLDRQGRRKEADKAAAFSNEVAGDLLPIAQAITDDQKSILTNILLNSGQGNSTNGNLSAADRQLIKLVRRWAPREMVVHLLDRLKAGPSATGDDAYIMHTIAAVTDDPEVAQYAQRYSQLPVSAVPIAAGDRDPRQVVLEQFVARVERSLNSVNSPKEPR
jgi:hypothetical protein